MRIFVYEHITGGGFMNEPLPASLVHEGDLMLRALVNDLMDIPGVEVLVGRDRRLSPLPTRVTVATTVENENVFDFFRRGCEAADAVWPVAPESAGVLERLTRITEETGRVLLGCRTAAIHICGSKLATCRRLLESGVRVVPTYDTIDELASDVERVVIKPDDGAGCINTRLMESATARKWLASRAHQGFVLQPYLPGEALSLSLLCRNGQGQLLACNRQRVHVENGEFRFTGVAVNDVRENLSDYAKLADRIAAAIPGLWGYVGVDLVGAATGPVVLEVNPRLTTSYAGLRRALHCNPAGLVLGLLKSGQENQLPSCATMVVEIGASHG